jgi:TetR/AcrR family transcriptional regulator
MTSTKVVSENSTRTRPLEFDRAQVAKRKRLILIKEAAKVFSEFGYSKTSLDDVASNLNLTKAALYYYFKSKQELLYECYCHSFDALESALDYGVTRGSNGKEKIELFVRKYLSEGLGDLHYAVHLRDQEMLEENYLASITQRRRSARDIQRALVEEGIADGTISPCDPKLAVMMVSASVAWMVKAYRPDSERSAAEYADEVVRLLFFGLAKPMPRIYPRKKRITS